MQLKATSSRRELLPPKLLVQVSGSVGTFAIVQVNSGDGFTRCLIIDNMGHTFQLCKSFLAMFFCLCLPSRPKANPIYFRISLQYQFLPSLMLLYNQRLQNLVTLVIAHMSTG